MMEVNRVGRAVTGAAWAARPSRLREAGARVAISRFVAVTAPQARALRLRDGSRTPSPSPWPSRADPRRRPQPAWVPDAKAVLTRRAPTRPRFRGRRVEGDGMV
jgi:hypothetical protein